MPKYLPFWLLLSVTFPALAATWDLTPAVATVQPVELIGQLVHWGSSTHMLCPSVPAPQQPPFSGCVDLVLTSDSGFNLEQYTPGCVQVTGNFERYGQAGDRFLVPSGHLLSTIGVVTAGSVERCVGANNSFKPKPLRGSA